MIIKNISSIINQIINQLLFENKIINIIKKL